MELLQVIASLCAIHANHCDLTDISHKQAMCQSMMIECISSLKKSPYYNEKKALERCVDIKSRLGGFYGK